MDPYAKALRISTGLHIAAALAVVASVFFAEVFRPRPAAVFTLMGPPAGLIAGGPSATQARPVEPNVIPAPQGPKLPSPAPSDEPKAAQSNIAEPASPSIAPPRPKPVRKPSDSGVLPKNKVTPKKPERLSFNDFQKKYAPKAPAKKATPKPAAAPARAVGPSAPSWEENLASRLNRRVQDQGERSAGTGLGGAAGSGIAGDGIPGATLDADALYSGTIYTYLNSVWEEPREVGSVRLSASVQFTVDRRGNLTAWRITRRSGNDSFDRSVQRVFDRVKEVPPPPTNQDYRLSVNFETRDS